MFVVQCNDGAGAGAGAGCWLLVLLVLVLVLLLLLLLPLPPVLLPGVSIDGVNCGRGAGSGNCVLIQRLGFPKIRAFKIHIV